MFCLAVSNFIRYNQETTKILRRPHGTLRDTITSLLTGVLLLYNQLFYAIV